MLKKSTIVMAAMLVCLLLFGCAAQDGVSAKPEPAALALPKLSPSAYGNTWDKTDYQPWDRTKPVAVIQTLAGTATGAGTENDCFALRLHPDGAYCLTREDVCGNLTDCGRALAAVNAELKTACQNIHTINQVDACGNITIYQNLTYALAIGKIPYGNGCVSSWNASGMNFTC